MRLEKMFEEIMTQIFQFLMKDINLQLSNPNQDKYKESLRFIIVKVLKTKNKKEILKTDKNDTYIREH